MLKIQLFHHPNIGNNMVVSMTIMIQTHTDQTFEWYSLMVTHLKLLKTFFYSLWFELRTLIFKRGLYIL